MKIAQDEFVSFLEDFLLEEEAKELEINITGDEETDAPAINSMQKANYFLKCIKYNQEDIQKIEELCAEEIRKTIERINTYKEAQIKPLQNRINYFTKLLENYTKHELENSGKKSIKLPNGTLSITKQQPVWNYEDETIIKFLTDNDAKDYVTTKIEEKIDKVALKKAISINKNGVPLFNGIEIPGIEITPREDKFTVK